MSKYWSEITKKIKPYVPGEQPKDRKYIKLNTNENPYPPSKKVVKAIKEAAEGKLQLYPDPNCDNLKEVVAKYYGLNVDEIFVGNGSDEVLAFSFMAFFNPDKEILFLDITYSFYEVYVNLFNLKHKLIELDDNFDFSKEQFNKDNGGIVIANPNAPTSKAVDINLLKDILDFNKDKVVLIDEAYVDFQGESTISLIKDYPNLLVVQTLSKSRALAGIRVGFAFGNKELIEGLNRIKNSINSYTVNSLSLAGAEAAFKDKEYFLETTEKIIKTREWTAKAFKELGFFVLESKTNFLFISHNKLAAKDLFLKLREEGILVRYFNKAKIDNYLRITIGTDEEMKVLLDKLKEIVLN